MKMLHASMLASLLAVSSMLAAQPTASPATITRTPGAATATQTLKTTATVTAIAPETRTVSLKRPDGQIVEIQVGEEVRNFGKIKVGDTVTVAYTEALSLELKKGHSSPATRSESQEVTAAPPGAQPRGEVGRRVSVLADVIAVDSKDQKVSLRGPHGNVVDLKVPDPDQLKRVKKGDQVQAVYTEALAIAVEPAPAK